MSLIPPPSSEPNSNIPVQNVENMILGNSTEVPQHSSNSNISVSKTEPMLEDSSNFSLSGPVTTSTTPVTTMVAGTFSNGLQTMTPTSLPKFNLGNNSNSNNNNNNQTSSPLSTSSSSQNTTTTKSTSNTTAKGSQYGMNNQNSASLANNDQILSKARLQELVKEVDPFEQLDEEVEDMLIQFVDDFVTNTVENACKFAKHRNANTVEVKDIQLHLEKSCNMWIPGYGTEDVKPYKKPPTIEAHKQRLALIRKSLRKY